jgi:hypothetical protein
VILIEVEETGSDKTEWVVTVDTPVAAAAVAMAAVAACTDFHVVHQAQLVLLWLELGFLLTYGIK